MKSGIQLSPTIEEYLEAILNMVSEGKSALGARLAERLQVSPPTVTASLQRMARDGLITTSQIRSHSTNDIACWFIDTDYNEEAFFVRHAYFCGDNEPYDRLKLSLKAEISEAAWASLYSTVSRPFDPPKTERIAVKVINHYGDEVLKVYQI